MLKEYTCCICSANFVIIGPSLRRDPARMVCGACKDVKQKDKDGAVIKNAFVEKYLNKDSSACANCRHFQKKTGNKFWAKCALGKISDAQGDADDGVEPALVYFLDTCGDFSNE